MRPTTGYPARCFVGKGRLRSDSLGFLACSWREALSSRRISSNSEESSVSTARAHSSRILSSLNFIQHRFKGHGSGKKIPSIPPRFPDTTAGPSSVLIQWDGCRSTFRRRGSTRRNTITFLPHDVNRMQFTQGRDLRLAPVQEGPPLNYFVYPYVEIGGKESPNVAIAFSFEDAGSTPAKASPLR